MIDFPDVLTKIMHLTQGQEIPNSVPRLQNAGGRAVVLQREIYFIEIIVLRQFT